MTIGLKQETGDGKPLTGWTIMFISFDFMRRLMFAFIITIAGQFEMQWLQLMLLMYLNQFYIMYIIHQRVYYETNQQIIETLNEIIILLTIYHFFCFTDFVSDIEVRSIFVGYSMLFMTGLNMTVNFTPICFSLL